MVMVVITIVFRKALSWMSLRYDNGLEIAISISRYLATTLAQLHLSFQSIPNFHTLISFRGPLISGKFS